MLKLNLLENALDFIHDAVKQLKDAEVEPLRMKYAILHLSSGIELLLKERLQREHWSLILEDVDNANRDHFDKGESRTVGLKQARKRLEGICEIDFKKHLKVLDRLGDSRNKLIHFKIEIAIEEAVSILVESWSFILDFEREHLDLTKDEKASAIFDQIRQKMVGHEEYVKERREEIEDELKQLQKKGWAIIDCPMCLQDALTIDGGEWECRFCRERSSWVEGMEEWLYLHEGWRYLDAKEQMVDPSITECPECEMVALYQFEDWNAHPPDPAWICLHCGTTWSWGRMVECSRCGRPMVSMGEGDSICCLTVD